MGNKEKSAAYKIFHYYYKAYMPQHFLYSDEYLDQFGLATSGDRETDKVLLNSPVLCQLTIAKMAMKTDQGADISLINPRDGADIYRILKQHLTDWNIAVSNDLFCPNDPPIEDLQILDDFAAKIYMQARFYLNDISHHTGLIGRLDNMNSNRVFKSQPTAATNQLPKEHKSISESITRNAFDKAYNWR